MESAASLSEAVVHAVLSLLKKDVAEHGRHLPQYFSFFLMYAAGGVRERTHLLKVRDLDDRRCARSANKRHLSALSKT